MGDVVGFPEFQERFETQSFFQRVNVLALQVLDALGFDGLCVAQFDDTNGDFFEFCEFGGSEAASPGDHFVLTFVQFAHQERCQNALRLEADPTGEFQFSDLTDASHQLLLSFASSPNFDPLSEMIIETFGGVEIEIGDLEQWVVTDTSTYTVAHMTPVKS